MLPGRRAADVITRKSLEGVGLAGSELVGVDDRAVRGRRGGIRVVEGGLVGVTGSRTGGYR